jgi:serine protease Do
MRFLAGFVFAAALCAFGAPASGQLPDIPPYAEQNRQPGSYLGIGVADLDSERVGTLKVGSDSGVQIIRVMGGSPAEKAGLKPGDILLTYNGENILGGQQLGHLAAETPAKRRIKLTYWRNGKIQAALLTTAPPPPASDLQSNMQALSEQFGRLRLSMPMDVPTPMLVWRNRVLGTVCEPLDPQLADYFGVKDGILVRFVEKGSPAEIAGVRSGDVLTSIGTHTLNNPHDVTMGLRSQASSKELTVSLVRNHRPLKLTIPIPDYPQ